MSKVNFYQKVTMIGLNEYEKYKVVRPIFGECKYDQYDIPIIKKIDVSSMDWNQMRVIGYGNANIKKANKHTIVLTFNYDKTLLALWNSPLKKVALFQNYAAVVSPDFSISPAMNINEIRHNVFMSRWLGVTWQTCGVVVLPSVGWGLQDTYDICLSSIEYESIVVVSTIGCQNNKKVFLDGFNEMKRRVNPPLIIVYGDMIKGMTGTFINFKYRDAFNKKSEQLKLDVISNIFNITEVA